MSARKKILLVEDDERLRESLAKILENSGFLVTQAGNGDIGQFMSLLSNYDLLISDISMPEVDGITMSKFIKSRLSTPILLISGLNKAEVEDRLKDAQAEMLLSKPFDEETLLRAVREILDKKSI